ncbi:MAG: hypothetical protein GQ574_00690 [Crocinitomix sp.]|nr:hypothetical protein [Crocinitomix sp.]
MRLFILFTSVCIGAVAGHTQTTLSSNNLVLMPFSAEHVHIDSQAVQAFNLDTNQIHTVDSLILLIVDFYNVQVTRGSLSLKEKSELDSLSNLQRDYQIVHKRKEKYKKRKLARFGPERQAEIMTFGQNQDSLYRVMISLHTRSFVGRSKGVVMFAGMGRDTIEITKYMRQYMPYLNKKGERMVYANCSRDYGTVLEIETELKTELENEFTWCGDCYEGLIMIRINLETKKVEQFNTN